MLIYSRIYVSHVCCCCLMLRVRCLSRPQFVFVFAGYLIINQRTALTPSRAAPFVCHCIHRQIHLLIEIQLKCVRKLLYTNLSLTFSPNEPWPKKVLFGAGAADSVLIKHALLLLLFMGASKQIRVIERERERVSRAVSALFAPSFSRSSQLGTPFPKTFWLAFEPATYSSNKRNASRTSA